ncbi:urease accessory protein UreD [Neptunicella sp. SCSIO 80796]|uniref:urease accessory protein UreD n=1 Tax=Neptunicella plasticusilytica TaxID=3117012 RepID=UPI003A4D66B3
MQNNVVTNRVVKNSAVKNSTLVKAKNAWIASLELDFDCTEQRTRLTKIKRQGPLSVQKAFYPEGQRCAHVYLLHPPAGIVSGDELHLVANLDNGADALITTPGANRFYRARDNLDIGDSKQVQISTFHLASQSMLEYLPQETLIYSGADAVNQVDIHLVPDSIYLGWEITCLGLPASQQPFTQGRFSQRNRIFCQQKLIYQDRIDITAANALLHHPAGLAGNTVMASFVLYVPALSVQQRHELLAQIRTLIIEVGAQQWLSVTDINGLVLARYLGEHAQQCKTLFIQIWQRVRPLCKGKQVHQPRIWFT